MSLIYSRARGRDLRNYRPVGATGTTVLIVIVRPGGRCHAHLRPFRFHWKSKNAGLRSRIRITPVDLFDLAKHVSMIESEAIDP